MTPADIAVVRRLLAHAKAQGWAHDLTTATDDRSAQHRWRRPGRNSVSIWRGGLAVGYLDVCHIESAQQAADLLAAVGLVPVELTSGWAAGYATDRVIGGVAT